MNTENVKLWITALRSGEYTQTKRALQDGTSYCCLGVACRVAEKEGVPVNLDPEGRLLGGALSEFCHNEANPQSEVILWLDIKRSTEAELITKNDRGRTFAQIADWLEDLL